MGIMLAAMLSGLATGTAKRVQKEREDNEALIENRLRLAATNKLRREKEREAQRALLNERYSAVSGYLPEEATEEQKLALVSNEAIAKEFIQKRSSGEDVDLNKFLVINKEKIPKGFTSTRQYLDSLTAAPEPVTQEQMQQSFGEQRGFLGLRTGVSAGRAEKIAQQYGSTAGELLAYEQPSEGMQMPEIARMNVEMLRKKEKLTPAQGLALLQSNYLDLAKKYGENDERTVAAKTLATEYKVRMEALDPDQIKFNDLFDKSKVDLAKAIPGTPEYQRAEREYKRLAAIQNSDKDGTKQTDLIRLFRLASVNAVENAFQGSKDVVITTDPVTKDKSYDYSKSPQVAEKVKQVVLAAIGRQARFYQDAQGMPLNQDVAAVLTAFQVPFDKAGRPIFDVAVPAPEPAPAGAAGAARVQPTAEAETQFDIPADAVTYLKTNKDDPDVVRQFNAKYGTAKDSNPAARFLGK